MKNYGKRLLVVIRFLVMLAYETYYYESNDVIYVNIHLCYSQQVSLKLTLLNFVPT